MVAKILYNVVTNTRPCARCKLEKSLFDFPPNKKSLGGRGGYCYTCHAEYDKETYNSLKQKDQDLRYRYGINLDIYNQLILKQNNKCAICLDKLQSGTKVHVDHCHLTDQVRGILCTSCNTSLGKFKESIEILQRAIDYLRSADMK